MTTEGLKVVLAQALATLLAHPLRSLLTALTVTFGTAVLMVLVSYGAGAPSATAAVLKSMGSTQIKVEPRWTSGPGGGRRGKRIEVRYDDLDRVRDACPSIGRMAAAWEPGRGAAVYAPERSWPWAGMLAVGVEYLDVAEVPIIEGRWFTLDEELTRERVAVLNLPLAEGLFPNGGAIGEWIESRGRRFEVIGVLYDGTTSGYNFFVPYGAAQGIGDESGKVIEYVAIQPVRPELGAQALREIREALGNLYHFDPADERALRVTEQTGFVAQVNAVSRGLELLVLTIALVALVLGCLGAANVVGITVAERGAEIGLRKALGATPAQIRGQVLAESLALCLAGGLLGVLLGLLAVNLLGPMQLNLSVQLVPRADFLILGVGLAVLVLVGTLAGLPAANRAAQLDPAVTLREG